MSAAAAAGDLRGSPGLGHAEPPRSGGGPGGSHQDGRDPRRAALPGQLAPPGAELRGWRLGPPTWRNLPGKMGELRVS